MGALNGGPRLGADPNARPVPRVSMRAGLPPKKKKPGCGGQPGSGIAQGGIGYFARRFVFAGRFDRIAMGVILTGVFGSSC